MRFLKTWKNLKKFNQQKNFKAWIFTIAKNSSLDFLRKKKMIVFSKLIKEDGEDGPLETEADPAPLPSEVFDRKNLREEVAEAIKKLSFPYRLVLNLYFNNELTLQEIADYLGEPLNTVKSRHRRAIQGLRNLLINNHAPK